MSDQDDADMRMIEGEQSVAPKDVPNAELLVRLEKLEALIASQNREGMLNKPEPTAYAEAPPPNQPSAVASPMSPQLQKLTDDALWLERSFTGQSMLVCVWCNLISLGSGLRLQVSKLVTQDKLTRCGLH